MVVCWDVERGIGGTLRPAQDANAAGGGGVRGDGLGEHRGMRILGHKAFILRTDQADTEVEGRRIIEVACEVKLRDEYGLRDGDAVEVTVGE